MFQFLSAKYMQICEEALGKHPFSAVLDNQQRWVPLLGGIERKIVWLAI